MPPTLDHLLRDQTWLRALARSLVADPHAADDVAQDAAVTLWTTPPADAAAGKSWLRTVVTRLGANRARGERRRGARERAAFDATRAPAPPDDVVALWEIRRRVVEAVLALDEPYRTTVLLRFFEGLSRAETAARMEVPEETVHTRQRRALTRLRQSLAALDPDADRDQSAAGSRALLLLAGWDREALPPRAPSAGATSGVLLVTTVQKTIAAAVVAVAAALGLWWAAGPAGPPRSGDAADTADASGVGGGRTTAAPPTDADGGTVADSRRGRDADPSADTADGSSAASGPADRDLDLHGVVVDEAGLPVAGARLVTRTYPRLELQVPTSFELMFEPKEGPSAISARNGTFRIRLTPGDTVSLNVAHEGFAEAEFASLAAGENVRLVLHAPVLLSVTVLDAAGTPVSEAALLLFENPGRGETSVHRTAVTGADGTYRFTTLPPGTEAFVLAQLQGHGDTPRVRVRLDGPGEQTVELRFAEGRRLAGQVTDAETAAPVAGARVGAGQVQAGAVTSGVDGMYVMDAWPADDAGRSSGEALLVTADGYAPEFVDVGSHDVLDVSLRRAGAYTGCLVDAERAPLAGTPLMVRAERVPSGGRALSTVSAVTGDDGRFVLSGLRADLAHTLYARSRDGQLALDVPAVGEPGASRDLGDLVVERGRTVSGRVTDADGRVVARATVTIVPAPSGARGPKRQGTAVPGHTDDLGRFRLTRVKPGASMVLVMRGNQQLARAEIDVPPDRDPDPLEIRAGSTSGLVVEVVDEDGAPVPDAGINVVTTSMKRLVATVDKDGRARFELSEGVRTVSAFLTDPARRAALMDGSATPQRGATRVRIVMQAAATIEGTIRLENGTPVRSGSILIAPREMWIRNLVAVDDDGRFRAVVAAHDVYDLTYTPEDIEGASQPATLLGRVEGVRPPARAIEMVLRKPRTGRTLTVRVVDPDGDAVPDARVYLSRMGLAQSYMEISDAHGVATFDGLLEVEHNLLAQLADAAQTPHLADSQRSLSVVPDGQEIELRLPAANPIRGIVVREDGTPVASATVEVTGAPGMSSPYTFTAADGRFVARVVATQSGPFTLTAHSFAEATMQWSGTAESIVKGAQDVRIVIRPPKR